MPVGGASTGTARVHACGCIGPGPTLEDPCEPPPAVLPCALQTRVDRVNINNQVSRLARTCRRVIEDMSAWFKSQQRRVAPAGALHATCGQPPTVAPCTRAVALPFQTSRDKHPCGFPLLQLAMEVLFNNPSWEQQLQQLR